MIDAVSLSSAVRAFSTGSASQVARTSETAAPDVARSAGGIADFSTMLTRMSSDAVDQVKTAEASAISGITGKASVQQVVEAVMAAEQTVQTAIAVRDKVVAAYQEISRMAI